MRRQIGANLASRSKFYELPVLATSDHAAQELQEKMQYFSSSTGRSSGAGVPGCEAEDGTYM